MIYDLIIVGGGAAGMMAAITAAEQGQKSIIIEKMPRLGKKLLATGNGRCNFTNSYLDDDCYRGGKKDFIFTALDQFTYEQTVEFFEGLGIACVEKDGYYYPASNQAATIADGLIYKISSLPIKVETGTIVRSIKKDKHFVVNTDKGSVHGRNVLVTTGGKAQEKLGSDGAGYAFAKAFGHKIVRPFPTLTALKVKEHHLKNASGVRCQCRMTVTGRGRKYQEQGELQITKYGISGVMVFQLSRYVIEELLRGGKPRVTLDLLPMEDDMEACHDKMITLCDYKTVGQWLEGYLPAKLAAEIVKLSGVKPTKKTTELNQDEYRRIWNNLKKLPLTIDGYNDFDQAQATAGGVSLKQISPYTMESELVEGLYFAGEVMDVDGTCGGYNLQWAWTSGYLAGRSIL